MSEPEASRPRTRAIWSAIDQGLSSSTNFLATLGVARYASERAVGAFAVSFALFQIVLGLARATCTDPYVMAHSASGRAAGDDAPAAAGTALVLGVGIALPTLVAAALVGGIIGTSMAVFAVLLPSLLVQDAWRFVLVSHYRPAAAAANDLAWLLVMLPFFVVFELGDHHPSAAQFTAVWTGGAAVASIVGMVQVGAVPRVARTFAYLRAHRRSWSALLPEYVITASAGWLVVFLLTGVKGSVELGHLRTVQTLFGPLSFAQLGAVLIVVPEGARLAKQDVGKLLRLCFGAALALTVVDAALAAALLLVPSSWMVSAIGPIWGSARPLVPAVALMLGASGMTLGAIGGLRAIGRSDLSFRVRARTAPVSVVLGAAGVFADGAAGMALGLAAAELLTAALTWAALRRETQPAGRVAIPVR